MPERNIQQIIYHSSEELENSGNFELGFLNFAQRIQVLEASKKQDEVICYNEENGIILLLDQPCSIVQTAAVDRNYLETHLAKREKDTIPDTLDSIPPLSIMVKGTVENALIIQPLSEKPFKIAKEVLPEKDYEIAYIQAGAEPNSLTVATFETNNPKADNRWILLKRDNILYVSSPGRLTNGVTDVNSAEPFQSLNLLDAPDKSRLLKAVLTETISEGVLIHKHQQSVDHVENSRNYITPITPDVFVKDVEVKYYIDESVHQLYIDELQSQISGYTDSMRFLSEPEQYYLRYKAENDALKAKRIQELNKAIEEFGTMFSDYGKYECKLITDNDTYRADVIDKTSGLCVQKICVTDNSSPDDRTKGLKIVWLDADNRVVEKPNDRKLIGPAEKLKSITNLGNSNKSVSTLAEDEWLVKGMTESAVAVSYNSLPYNLRKGAEKSELTIPELIKLVSIAQADRNLKERASVILQWLADMNDTRLSYFLNPNGEASMQVLSLTREYETVMRHNQLLLSKRGELTEQPPNYDKTTYLELLKLDPREGEQTKDILALIEKSGLKTLSYENIQALFNENPVVAELVAGKIDLTVFNKEKSNLYEKQVDSMEEFKTLLGKLPLTQTEYTEFLKLGENNLQDLDLFARSLVLNALVFWRNQTRSNDSKVGALETVNRVKKVADQLKTDTPLEMSIYCALCEATHPFKVMQRHPDISEFYFMKKLVTMDKVAKMIHPSGIHWTIVNEATAGGELLGLSEKQVGQFQEEIEEYIEIIGGKDSIKVVSMQDVLRKPLEDIDISVLDNLDHGQQSEIWSDLVVLKAVEGDFDINKLKEVLGMNGLYENLLHNVRINSKPQDHRIEVFAETFFPGDLGLDLDDDQLLSLYGHQFMGSMNPFKTEIPPEKIASELSDKLQKQCEAASIHFDSHMTLRPLMKTLTKNGLIEGNPVLAENVIPATITRKGDRFVFAPVDNGLFPMHGIGVITPENKVHVIPLHKILSQPERYVMLTVKDRMYAVLDTPDFLVEEKVKEDLN